MAESIPQSQEKNSKVYTLYYAFFLIPLIITIFGVMFFFMFKVLTYESNSPYEYLTNVQIGSATKRWQSAYELSKLLSNPELVPLDRWYLFIKSLFMMTQWYACIWPWQWVEPDNRNLVLH